MRTTALRAKRLFVPSIELLEARIAPAGLVVSNLNDSGKGSLRDALTTAETHQHEVISFAKGLHGTITLDSDLPKITSDVTINGPGAASLAIDGGGYHSVFQIVGHDLTASLSGLTVKVGWQLMAAGCSSMTAVVR